MEWMSLESKSALFPILESLITEVTGKEYDFKGWESARKDINAHARQNLVKDELDNKLTFGFELRNLIVHKRPR